MACAAVCALGMYVNATFIASGFLMNLLSIIVSVYLIYQVSNKSNSENSRMGYLAAFAFQMGFLVGPAMHYLVHMESELVIMAVLYTSIAFVSFSCISLFSKRRSYLFLGSIIVTLVQGLILYRVFGWLLGYSYGADGLMYLMFGLLVACLYIIYDTQMIIERAERGDKDVVGHALLLFIDLFDLFIKILRILIKLNEDKKKDERNKKK